MIDDRKAVQWLLASATETLDAASVADSAHDAEQLYRWATGCSAIDQVIGTAPASGTPEFNRFQQAIDQRASREPLQLIVGEVGFLDFTVRVGPGVLIPRPETEVTAQTAIEFAKPGGRILDCGTGSGAIAISCARAVPRATVSGTERSMTALRWAVKNSKALAPDVVLSLSSYFDIDGEFDLVVANPPYVGSDEWIELQPEVRDFEPRSALVPSDGRARSDIEFIVSTAVHRLRPGGVIVVEIASTQGDWGAEFARSYGYRAVEVREDLAGRDRVLIARVPS